MTQEQKHYYAFISHSSADEKIALWLRNQLENYHIPSAIQRDYHAPKQLKPIFVYQTDLAGIKLKEALGQSLTDSKYLIVICSPDAAKSEYVNGEVQHFIDTGRADKIMPFIISGSPYASLKGNTADECFPPALVTLKNTDAEQRGVNLPETEKKMGDRKAAVVNVIASMLGVRMDVLWDRYRRHKIRKYAITAGLALLFCLTGLFVWDYNRPTYRYFADYVDKWGVPEGVIELTKEQQRHRNRMYQFEYRRIPFGEPNPYSWRVTAVRYVNSAKRVKKITNSELQDRYSVQKIEYNKQTGDVARLVFCDTKDKVLLRHVLSERNGQKACVADFIDSQEQRGTGFIGANLNSMSIGQMDKDQQKSNIVRFVYERDSKGYIVRQTYHANNDYNLSRSAVPDGEGIFGRSFVLDSLGRRVSIDYLGLNGEHARIKNGIAGRRYEYGTQGNINRTTYVNRQGKPILNEEQWAVCVDVSNEWGNSEEELFIGADGQPCFCKDGYARLITKYDNRGYKIEHKLYDIDGKLCLCKNGYAQVQIRYDKRGNMIEWTCYDTEGQLCLSKEGYAKNTGKYNDNDDLIEVAYYGMNDSLCISNKGYAKAIHGYDNNGNTIKIAFYGQEGLPCLSKEGYAKALYKYDNNGNMIEGSYYDTDGQHCLNQGYYARWTLTLDERGNAVEGAYYGADGQPCLNKDCVAKWTAHYDESGNLIENVFYGTDNKPCLDKNGCAKVVYVHDDHGNAIEKSYFDTEGKPCLHKDGNAKIALKYDDKGNCIEAAYYGIEGNLCIINGNYAKVTYQYDNRGNVIERAYYGIDGQPTLSNDGFAKWSLSYDSRGNSIEECFYDTKGKLCLTSLGFARCRSVYNDRNEEIERAYFGKDNNLCYCIYGYALRKRTYDEKGNSIDEAYFGTDKKPCLDINGMAGSTTCYDERGNMIEGQAYDLNRKPCFRKDGTSKLIIKYNDRGKAIEIIYLDTINQLCLNQEGYAKKTIEYDQRGNMITEAYYDVNNLPCKMATGYAKAVYQHDARGNVICISYLNTENQLCMMNQGFAKRYTQRNERDEIIGEQLQDSLGNSISDKVLTHVIVSVDVGGAADQHGVTRGCVLLKWNDWTIGESIEKLLSAYSRDAFQKKNIYFLSPNGDIIFLHVENGKVGTWAQPYYLEKSQAIEALKLIKQ